MTDKELKKLSRSALLEMLLEQSRENDRLRAQVEELARQLSDRQFKIDQAGSIAEASMQINQVFESAQAAAEQYLENIRALSGRQEQVCRQLEEESTQKAQRASRGNRKKMPDNGGSHNGEMRKDDERGRRICGSNLGGRAGQDSKTHR